MSHTEGLVLFCSVIFLLGFIAGAPVWIYYALKTERDRREWEMRRRVRMTRLEREEFQNTLNYVDKGAQ